MKKIITLIIILLPICLYADANSDLFDAADSGNLKAVKQALLKGADLKARDYYGWTALSEAAEGGHLEIVKYLISKDADVNVRNNKGFTPVMLAAKNNNRRIIKLLIEEGTDVSMINNNGETALTCLRTNYNSGCNETVDSCLETLLEVIGSCTGGWKFMP